MGSLGKLLPLLILFTVLGFMAYFGFQIYLYANELADKGKKSMEKKNVVFTKDGMKVGVKEVRDEDYEDKTQSFLVKAWNHSSFPAYKSRLGWNKPAQKQA
ncbi:uncharacterized protein K452DRAFT_304266 [Aplosporella prunicola CBS 121167]|uniref:Uncharacterized protein n=1 Tax=Aplosporella prunicola CBS 121167 TaxID=1176127 RepID=A0A6A6BVW4_9PEZI|nr:uncharacterized protein K452DRAFT_304266 [Aplosporella prunicola CBS 121167]KAF2147425.1 hypothetical protein K452DRAFT_304266 [Aplosporella prunicola CBS 121167]